MRKILDTTSTIGLLEWKLGNYDRAVLLAEEGANLHRHSLLGPLAQAVVLVGANRLDEGKAALDRARALRPDLGPGIVQGMLPFAQATDRAALLSALRQTGF